MMVSEMRARDVDEFGIETIGIWWLKEEITDKEGNPKAYSWWGICKKTRKVAFMRVIAGTLYEMLPLIMNDILLSEEFGGCDDGKYCFNLDCPYCKNARLITSIKNQMCLPTTDGIDDDALVRYFERSIQFINEEFLTPTEELTKRDLDKIFVDDYSECTVNENAFKTSLSK